MLSNIGASIGKVFKVPKFDMPMSLAPNSIILRFVDEITTEKKGKYKSTHRLDVFVKVFQESKSTKN